MNDINFHKELKPKVILGVAAHPDDLDFGASGSLATWIEQGSQVYYLILTNGNKGSEDTHISSADLIILRQKEQRKAADILGVKDVFFLSYEDGCLECNLDVKRDIARCIRRIKPDVLVTMDPSMIYSARRGYINHPDHRAAGQAALDACFPLARDHLSFPELLAEGLLPHKTPTVMLINFDEQNYYVDISQTIDKKLQALTAHSSQMPNIKAVSKLIKTQAKDLGKICNVDYAEAFVRIDVN